MTSTVAKRETLPENVRPKEYVLSHRTDLAQGTFSGSVIVLLDVREETRTITLNSVELDLSAADVTQGAALWGASSIDYDEEREQATIRFDRPLVPGTASLMIRFTGKMSTSMSGYYISNYEVDGVKKRAGATQFEAPHARRAFPCWDQPDCKATFTVTLDIEEDLTAISNGEVRETTVLGNGRKLVAFDPSPIMSTYLVAWFVGEFECVEKRAKTGTMLRVWATKGKAEQGRFALEATDRILSYLTDYFGIPYAMPKLDQIGVPDFAFGAMENWGAISYREVLLLVSSDTSKEMRQATIETLAHEIVHQWFGNLVTMQWWDDLWLNEAFATWLGTKCSADLYPEFGIWPQFVNSDYGAGMQLDGLESTHPICACLLKASEVDEAFDAVSYNKGGSLMRMLETALGADSFRDGLRLYMQRHTYANTVANDLWACLSEASGQDVAAFMRTWTEKPGYPVLTVHSSRARANRRQPTVTQSRFHYGDICGNRDSSADPLWRIPVLAKTDLGTHTALLDSETETIALPEQMTHNASFLFLNAESTGFYRTRYDAASLAELLPAVASKALSAEDRVRFEDDAYALCRAGMMPASEYLRIAASYAGETEYAVWCNLLPHLSEMRLLFGANPQIVNMLNRLGLGLVSDIVSQIGWDPDPSGNESHSQAMLRPIVLGFAGRCGDMNVVSEAHLRFEMALDDRDTLSGDLRGVVYGLAATHGSRDRFEELRALHNGTDSPEEKARALTAIGRIANIDLRQEALEWCLSKEVRAQDARRVVAAVSGHPDSLAWDFVTSRWTDIAARHKANNQALGYYVTNSTHNMCKKGDAAAVRRFFAETKPVGLSKTIAQSIERVVHNQAWCSMNAAALRQLSQQVPATASAEV